MESTLENVSNLFGDKHRLRLLIALLDGRAMNAKSIAELTQTSPQAISNHLKRLIEAGWLGVQTRGRERYFFLANAEVAYVLEQFQILIEKKFVNPEEKPPIRVARSCYDHLAGWIAVKFTQYLLKNAMIEMNIAENRIQVTESGATFFKTLEIDVDSLPLQKRAFAFPCLDWSERLPHVGGALGAALLDTMLKKRWFLHGKTRRVLTLTELGKREFKKLGVNFNAE